MKILLFDDIPDNRARVGGAVRAALADRGEVIDFLPGAGGKKDGTYEERLILDLQAAPNVGADLIVADRDLSGYIEHYPGLSENTVRRVADILGIPECGYARGEKADSYIERSELREACIRLAFRPEPTNFAKRVVSIAEGFKLIDTTLEGLRTAGRQSPGKLLSVILGKPEYSDKIALYASGDQSRLHSIHQMSGTEQERRRRLTCLLGYWLWDSVLRYPGVTVGEIPASSHLNIDEHVFIADTDVQDLFSSARYRGPFCDAKIKMWWRGMLDDIVAQADVEDGNSFAREKLRREVKVSTCCEDPKLTAGYYCMLKERPVSLANSKGGLAWFPRGADLARVSNAALEELGPWL